MKINSILINKTILLLLIVKMLENTKLENIENTTNYPVNIPDKSKNASDKTVCSPLPIKRKTCIFKPWEENHWANAIVVSKSYNKFEELKKRDINCTISPFKTAKKPMR